MDQVVVGALVDAGQVLLVRRSPDREVFPSAWDLPGGHIEAGEAELDALARELQEELGVQISAGSAVPLQRWHAGTETDGAVITAWLVPEWQGTPSNAAPHEHDEVRWFPAGGMPPLAHALLNTLLANAIEGL